MLAYGSKSIIVVIPCIFLTLILVRRSANIFNLIPTVATLIAVGTSICGATAIVATAPTIKAKQSEVVFRSGKHYNIWNNSNVCLSNSS